VHGVEGIVAAHVGLIEDVQSPLAGLAASGQLVGAT
jgi:hypothetical protein